MKFAIFGTNEIVVNYVKAIKDYGEEVTSLISLPKQQLPLNSIDLSSFAKSNKIPYHEFEDINSSQLIETLKKYDPDYILLSWPKILKKELINLPKYFTIGTHPTEIPFNRGRHPLHWMINLGISESKLTFFKLDEGVDTGEILLRVPFSINKKDTIKNSFSRLLQITYNGTKTLCKMLEEGNYGVENQDESKTNYWRKRSPHDTIIDLRMPFDLISRIVRSYSLPYPCAKLIFEKEVLAISEVYPVETGISYEELRRIEPGKVINFHKDVLRVKVDDYIVDLRSLTPFPSKLLRTEYIHPPSQYLLKHLKSVEDSKTLKEKLYG